jgi:hypothetical protein
MPLESASVAPPDQAQIPASRPLLIWAAVLMIASIAIQVVRDRGWHSYQPPSTLLWIQSGPLAQRLALGFDNLVADIYWMRAVVYYGGQRRGTEAPTFELLYPLLDLVTTLDPRFRVAYRFGAIFLTEGYPSGPGRPDLAIALLEKGARVDPQRWEYLHDIGFVRYWALSDYRGAAHEFERAAALSGAPAWLRPLAAVTLVEGGDRRASRLLWQQMLANSDTEWIRHSAERRLLQLDALDQIDLMNRTAAEVAAGSGHPARSWAELMPALRLRDVPLDPAGTPYAIDPRSGLVTISPDSPLWPLPAEPRRQPGPPQR